MKIMQIMERARWIVHSERGLSLSPPNLDIAGHFGCPAKSDVKFFTVPCVGTMVELYGRHTPNSIFQYAQSRPRASSGFPFSVYNKVRNTLTRNFIPRGGDNLRSDRLWMAKLGARHTIIGSPQSQRGPSPDTTEATRLGASLTIL